MDIFSLDQTFFNKKFKNKSEVEHNKNGSRPYFYSFKYNNQNICIPLRSNAKKTPDRFKLGFKHLEKGRPYPAVDSTKSIILSDRELYENKGGVALPRRTYRYLEENESLIKQKFENHINDYVTTITNGNINKPNVKFSTLQYYHDELDLNTKIENQLLKKAISELTDNGQTNKYTIMKDKLKEDSKNKMDKFEDLDEFSNLCKYDTYIDKNSSIDNPTLIIKKNENHLNLNANDLRNNPDKYVNEFLDYKPKKEQQNDLDL